MRGLGGLSLVALVLATACGEFRGAADKPPTPIATARAAGGHVAAPLPADTPEVVIVPATEPATPGLSPSVAGIPARVYVPNELSASVSVIDPETYQVIGRIKVGPYPQHVTPGWDLTRLYVNDDGLTELDARTGAVIGTIKVPMPYNLYFSLDGSKALVVAEDLNRIDFYERTTWKFLKSVHIPWPGINHLDMSADGSYLIATTEYSGRVVKVDVNAMALIGNLVVGGFPIDVKLAPAGDVFYVTNQSRHGVSLVDGAALKEVGFIQTGRGAHGLTVSRDETRLYVSNRLAGTISVIEFSSRKVVANWTVGGSPDMLTLSADGRRLWTGNRFGSTVTVIDTTSGEVVRTIPVESAPHGLTFFPQPGRVSIGHNGVYR